MIKLQKLAEENVTILNARLKNEFNASFMYRACGNWCKNVGFGLAAKHYYGEAESELEHAKKIESFMLDWNVTPEIPAIEKPKTDFSNLGEIIELTYKAEYNLYELYEDDSAKILKTGDVCLFDFLQILRHEQKESVAQISDLINKLNGVDVKDKFQMLLLEPKLF